MNERRVNTNNFCSCVVVVPVAAAAAAAATVVVEVAVDDPVSEGVVCSLFLSCYLLSHSIVSDFLRRKKNG